MYYLRSDVDGAYQQFPFDYAAGDRVVNTFHMGIMMNALWRTWKALAQAGDSRAPAVRQRLVDMATYYRDYGPDPDGRIPLYTGWNVNTGERIDTSMTGYGTPSGVYTIPVVNGLVFGYKLTGTQSYLDAAWDAYIKWHSLWSGSPNTIGHYTDSRIGTSGRLLSNNKGELQYVYALFENNGHPTVVSDNIVAPAPPTSLRAD
jgi:hypothetical protein